MQYSKDLNTKIKTIGINFNEAILVSKQLLLAIEYLHFIGISHGDIKPRNIQIGSDENKEQIFLSNFGRSNRLDTRCFFDRHIRSQIEFNCPVNTNYCSREAYFNRGNIQI